VTYNFEISYIFVSLGIIAAIYFVGFGFLRRDNFRSRIRELRDDLFDFMWQNGHSFETPAYRETRQMLNGTLLISNELGPVMFVICLYMFASKFKKPTPADSLEKLKPGPLKEKLMQVRHQAVRELITFIYLEGVFGFFVKIGLVVFHIAKVTYTAKQWAQGTAEHFIKTIAAEYASDQCRRMAGVK
jgi:hypothetical protein